MSGNDQVFTKGGAQVTILGSANAYKVEGGDAAGVAASGMPVQMGGVDGGGTIHPLLTDTFGAPLSGFVGTQGNLWNGGTVVTSGTSPAIDLHAVEYVAIFGHLSAAGTVTIKAGQDLTNFYATGTTIVASGAADVYALLTWPARSLQCVLNAGGTTVVTLTAAGKS